MVSIFESPPGAWIRASGEDAFGFLQSQFANDLARGPARRVVYGLWLDRKGRVEADGFVFQLPGEGYYICSYFCEAAAIIRKLEKNIVADDVSLADRTAGVAFLSWWGPEAETLLPFLGLETPPPGSCVRSGNRYLWRGRRSREENFDLLFKREEGNALKRKLEAFGAGHSLQWIEREEMQAERIQSGIPSVPADIGPTDLPQEGGLEADAVSFRKGCYLGQEVMSRLHAMGKVNRSLRRVRLPASATLPELPAALYCGDREAGELRSVALRGGSFCGLALLKNRFLEAENAFALAPKGEKIAGILK